ncbi:MAG: general secretion pathway protein, partial [Proteobacteria bacterium]|nr:general secretion pathway protein [Pseudomonadota bacterium]
MSSLLTGLRKLSAVSWGKGGLSLGRLSLRRPSLRRVVEAALILLLLVQAGRLVWLFAAPTPQAVEARPLPEVDLGVMSRFDAFFRNGGDGAEAAPSDGGGLTLFGVRADGGGGGSAIIGLSDGRQVSVGAGEEVEPGLTLSAVAPDHVMLSRGGAPFRLDFPDIAPGVAPVAPVAAAQPA